MKQWYALNTRTSIERRVDTELRLRGVETFLPLVPPEKARSSAARVAFFPGYLFVQVDLATESTLRWRWTPGLNRIVSYGDVPIAIPEEVIDLLRVEVERRSAADHHLLPRFHPGDLVRISRGPFRDMMAIFEGPTTPSMRVQVLLKAMGRATRVRLDVSDLETVSGAAAPAEVEKRPRRTRGRGRRIRQPAG